MKIYLFMGRDIREIESAQLEDMDTIKRPGLPGLVHSTPGSQLIAAIAAAGMTRKTRCPELIEKWRVAGRQAG